MRFWTKFILAVIMLFLPVCLCLPPASAATVTTSDNGPGSLHVAIESANAAVASTIYNKGSLTLKHAEAKPSEAIPADISSHWAKDSIMNLINAGIANGYPDGAFQPDRTITRAEFASMLVKALKLKASDSGRVFSDTATHWAKDNIAIAEALGIISGCADNSFQPDTPITREQMAVMVVQAAKLNPATSPRTFTDGVDISPWAKAGVDAASQSGFITDYPDGRFRPQGNTSRAEASIVIGKLLPTNNCSNICGYYEFDENIYTNPLSSFFAVKGYMPYYGISKNALMIINNENGSIQEFAAIFAKSSLDKEDFKLLFEPVMGIPDISQYRERYQYAVFSVEGTPEYRLYVMDGEVWLATMHRDVLWSIYKLVKTDEIYLGNGSGAVGPVNIDINSSRK